ncbi:hypothetical protein CVT25_009611 [Psilocybe cyanescens]|uniref:Uncharacterized protein n=1 Tax=Psilocybe cyanescens TaxID=93625 RepID=A0A409XGV0_PSICY|nr:hypothetical protein CVT25_009611 [Psilocybe cyanescens]
MATGTALFEHSYYIGSYIGGIMYGFELSVYFMILESLFRRGNKSSMHSKRFCAIYSTIMVLLTTIDVACNAVWGEEMWITYRDQPGGVAEYIKTKVSVGYETLGSVSVVGSVFMGDALLIYRLFLVYGRNLGVILVPTFAYIVGFVFPEALAIQQLVLAGKPHGDFFGKDSVRFAVAYYTITICLNIVVTIFICVRLFRLSRRFSSTLGRENGQVYGGAAAILIESAAPYSLLGMMYLVPFSLQYGTGILFGQLWSKMSGIAPLLIILRVVNGRAWSEDGTQIRTPLTFVPPDVTTIPSPLHSVAFLGQSQSSQTILEHLSSKHVSS